MNRLHTVKEACDLMRITAPTLYKLARQGKLKLIKIGSQTRITEDELIAFLSANIRQGGGTDGGGLLVS